MCVGGAIGSQEEERRGERWERERDGVARREMRIMKDSRDIGNIC